MEVFCSKQNKQRLKVRWKNVWVTGKAGRQAGRHTVDPLVQLLSMLWKIAIKELCSGINSSSVIFQAQGHLNSCGQTLQEITAEATSSAATHQWCTDGHQIGHSLTNSCRRPCAVLLRTGLGQVRGSIQVKEVPPLECHLCLYWPSLSTS